MYIYVIIKKKKTRHEYVYSVSNKKGLLFNLS